MNDEPIATEHSHCHHNHQRISWSAIVIGALVALGLGFLLNLFGLAIGLSAFTLNTAGTAVVAIGGLIGILIGIIVSMLASGYAAGYLGRLCCPKRNLGIIYGFSTWTLALILTALITVPLTQHVTDYTKVAAPAVSITANKSDNASPSMSTNLKAMSANIAPTPLSKNANQATINVTAPAKALAWSVFCIFILFFVGALACCFGACWGMGCRRED